MRLRSDEIAVMLALLRDHPRGRSDLGIALELSLNDDYVYKLLVRLRVSRFVCVDSVPGTVTQAYRNFLTANGWLKAVMLERSRSSKERAQLCGG